METVNAIARVRFSSARPQVVQLHKPGVAHVELLCMEAGQKLTVDKTPVVYYVITGSASIASAGKTVVAAAGHTVSLDEFFDHGRRDTNPSAFMTRLKVGPKLVDAKAVATLNRSRVPGSAVALLVLAVLVAVAWDAPPDRRR